MPAAASRGGGAAGFVDLQLERGRLRLKVYRGAAEVLGMLEVDLDERTLENLVTKAQRFLARRRRAVVK